MKRRAAKRTLSKLQLAAVLLHHLARDRQTQPGALRPLRAEERVEYPLFKRLGDSGPVVLDDNLQYARWEPRRANLDAAPRVRRRVRRVGQKIQQAPVQGSSARTVSGTLAHVIVTSTPRLLKSSA